MARADSTVRVNIIGDAKSFQKAASQSEKASGRIGSAAKTAGGIIAGAFAVDAVLDFAQTALSEADRVGDATTRLQEQLGDLSAPIIEAAGHMEELGGSQGDVLELEATFADIGTAAGIADDKLAPMAVSAAEAALALSLITDRDPSEIITDIAKAAGGSEKPLKNLGINLTDAEVAARAMADTGKPLADTLTDGELATARMELIMEKLAPRVDTVTGAEADLETQQRTLQAKFETFTGRVGDALDGPLTDLLTWVLAGIDGFDLLGGKIDEVDDALKGATGGALGLLDVLKRVLAFAGQHGLANLIASSSGAVRTGSISGSQGAPHPGITVNVQGGSPEVVEQAVLRAVQSARSTGRIP